MSESLVNPFQTNFRFEISNISSKQIYKETSTYVKYWNSKSQTKKIEICICENASDLIDIFLGKPCREIEQCNDRKHGNKMQNK